MSLTPKQAQFVREYLIDLNATQAAKRCGYSEKTAEVQGCRLLKNAKVAEAVEHAIATRAERTEITADRVLQELAKIGFADIRRIFTPGGNLLPPTDMDDAIAAAVSSVEVVTRTLPGSSSEGLEEQAHGGALKRQGAEVEYVHKIKLTDKLGALTQIGRHLGMFTDKVDLNAKHGPSDELKAWLDSRP